MPPVIGMSEQNIVEIRLTDEQKGAFAAVLRAAHAPGSAHRAAILAILTDSYVPEEQCSVLRLQVAMVDWRTGQKIAGILTEKALPTEPKSIFA